MKIEVGDRVRALEDCRMAGRGPDRYFYREGDTGSVERFDGLGAWVKWDNNHIDGGVWYASTEVLALIEEDTSGVDVLAVMEEAEANTYSALSGRIREARAVVDALANAAVDAAELLESVAPHHPQTAKLRAVLAQQPAPVAPVGVEVLRDLRDRVLPAALRYHATGPGYIEEAQEIVTRALADQQPAPVEVDGFPPDVQEIIRRDEAAWALAERAEAAGAERDSDDNETWWTLRIEQFYALAQQPAAVDGAMAGWVADGDTIPAYLIDATRNAIRLEFGNNGTDGYYKRILVRVFTALALAAQQGGRSDD